jgi:tetratricopeptide (TPR) repeat protein
MLEDYVESCNVVIHFIGDMAGSAPATTSVHDLLKRRPELATRLADKGLTREDLGRLSYTQWEAWLAVGFSKDGAKRNLVIVAPAASVERDPKFDPTEASRASQAEHLRRLKAVDLYPGPPFTSADNLAVQVLTSAVLDAALSVAGLAAKTTPSGGAILIKPRNLPFASLGGLFAGRDEDLADLHNALLGAKGAPVALCGLGGIGKTRLAIEYAWSREAVYSALLFVSASDGAALNAGLAALTAFEILDLPEKEARDDATKITAALRWLESNPTWLMILDNVDDRAAVAEVAKLMPRLKGGHVVVTARASNFPAGVRKLELSTLDENAAAQFLLDRTDVDRNKSRNDIPLARELARELGGLALGLEQAGAHIAADRIGFARYLKLWTESREKALAWADAAVTGSDRTLATTWATSVARLSPESRRLLERLAFLAPDPVPDSLLDAAVPGEAREYDAGDARGGLYAYSLISRVTADDGGTPGFVVHRLVQDFACRAMSDERHTQTLREALEWVNVAFVGAPNDVRNWPTLDPLAPHALEVARQSDLAGIAEPTVRLLNQLGGMLKEKADYAQAEPLYRRALLINEQSYGPDHPNVATGLTNLAQLLQDTNRLAEAESLMRRVLAIDEKSSGPDHSVIGLGNLAALLKDTNRLAEAEPLMRRALAIDEQSYGPDHPKVAKDLNNLAMLLRATNRLADAEPLMRRALAIDEQRYGPDHPEVAIRLGNLAVLLHDTNRLGEAEQLMCRALAIDEQSYGPDHPKVAKDLSNLALLFQATIRPAEAEPMMRRALAIDEQTFGPNHPNVAIGLDTLAGLLRTTGRFDEAEPLMRRALLIDEQSFGLDHPNVAIRLSNLASLLYRSNRLSEAEPLARRVLAIDKKSFGSDHPNVAIHLHNLAELLQNMNRPAEAEPLLRHALAIFDASSGSDHPNTVTVRKKSPPWRQLLPKAVDKCGRARQTHCLPVMPAKSGHPVFAAALDSRLRGNDKGPSSGQLRSPPPGLRRDGSSPGGVLTPRFAPPRVFARGRLFFPRAKGKLTSGRR